MGQRILTGIIGAFILVVVIIMPPVYTRIILGAIVLLALFEIYRPLGFFSLTKFPLAIAGFTLAVLILIFDYSHSEIMIPVICIYIMVMFILAVIYHKTIKFSDIAVLFFTTLYVSMMLIHVSLTRELPELGNLLIFAVFIGAFITDTGAYFVGSFFGKHKLLPEISPKKTVEGLIGGISLTFLAFLIYGGIALKFCGVTVNWLHLCIIAVILPLAAQMGDLSASMIKRELSIKDYGHIMPGHGGILDRFDSVIFVAPVFYYMNLLLPIFSK